MKYEYYVITNSTYLGDKLLNKLGEEGWELVTHMHQDMVVSHVYTFKREKIAYPKDIANAQRYDGVKAKTFVRDEAADITESSWMDEYREEYDAILKSGMFFEWHPTWTGEWEEDKYAFCHNRKNKKK